MSSVVVYSQAEPRRPLHDRSRFPSYVRWKHGCQLGGLVHLFGSVSREDTAVVENALAEGDESWNAFLDAYDLTQINNIQDRALRSDPGSDHR